MQRALFFRLAIFTVVISVFGSSIPGQFLLWDDTQHILLNSHLRSADFRYFWSNAHYGLFAPMIYSVWSVLFLISKEPTVFHALNLILHAANVLLVFELLRRWLKGDPWQAFLGALIFALHPLQVEPVAWISGGRDLMSAFFGLAATLLIVQDAAGRSLSKQWPLVCGTILFALGLLAKPSLAPLPVALFALDYFRPREERGFSRLYLSTWAMIGLFFLSFTFSHQAALSDPRLEATWPERGLVAIHAAGFYVSSFLVPWNLSFNYDRTIEMILRERLYIISIAWLLGGLGLVILIARTFGKRIYGYFLFTAICLTPVLGLVPFAGQAQSTVYDRYMYLPMLGLALVAGSLAREKVLRQLLLASLTVFAALSLTRTLDWRSDRSLSQSAIDIKPNNFIALNNLAIQELNENNLASAESLLRLAWKSRPKEALAPANLSHTLWLKNDIGGILQEIKPLTEAAIFLHYNQREIESLAMIYRMTARALNATLDRAGASRAYEKAVAYRPEDSELRNEYRLFQRETQ